MLTRDSHIKIVEFIKENHINSYLKKERLLAMIDGKYGTLSTTPNEIDEIYSLIDSYSDVDNNTIEEIFKENKEMLNQHYKNRMRIKSLEEAKKYIEEGNVNKGIEIAKGLEFDTVDKLDTTWQLMLGSVYDSNGFTTGIEILDKEFGGLHKGNLLSIAGDTGSMKTMISVWLCLKILERNPGYKCLYFEKEMPAKDIGRRLISKLLKMPQTEIMKAQSDEQKSELAGQVSDGLSNDINTFKILDRFVVVPADYFNSPMDMLRYIENYKPDIWCLDFLTQLGSGDSSDTSGYTKFTMDVANKLKAYANHTDTLGIILNQVKKGVRERKNKLITLDDIEWSSTISQVSAYIFATLYPSNYINTKHKDYYYLHCLKSRFSTKPTLCFHASPHISDFIEIKGLEYERMIDFFYAFITDVSRVE